jgi:hypothetical protein
MAVLVKTRVTRIALALDLGEYVLAFVTRDMLFVVSFLQLLSGLYH